MAANLTMPTVKLTRLQDSVRTRLPMEPKLYATPPIIPDGVMGDCFRMLTRLVEGRAATPATIQAVRHACEVSMAIALADRDRAVERQKQVELLLPRPVLAELPWYRQPSPGPDDKFLSQVECELPDITEDEEEDDKQTDDSKGVAGRSGRRAERTRGVSGSSPDTVCEPPHEDTDGSGREAGQGASSVSPPTPGTPASRGSDNPPPPTPFVVRRAVFNAVFVVGEGGHRDAAGSAHVDNQ